MDYRQAMAVYYAVQDVRDHEDVESEIAYREQEGEFTKEQARELRANINDIVYDYRGALDNGCHDYNVLINILFRRM